jgi:hypothetical protein
MTTRMMITVVISTTKATTTIIISELFYSKLISENISTHRETHFKPIRKLPVLKHSIMLCHYNIFRLFRCFLIVPVTEHGNTLIFLACI